MTFILDRLHEELKDIYISNEKKSAKETKSNWNEADKKVTVNVSLQEIAHSIITDIFGGIIRTEFHIEGSRNHSVNFDRCFVMSLDIPENGCTINDCLDNYFKVNKVDGYQVKGKTVKASQKLLFEKLPNVLIINLKRFVYTDQLIKKKEHVFFEDSLTIEDRHVSPHLQLGVFKKASAAGSKRNYRLFSVVEHIGKFATRGHYVTYSLDACNEWIKFDDTRWSRKDWEDIQVEA